MFFKIYAFLITPFMVISFLGTDNMGGYLNIIISIIGLLGVYLYAFKKQVLPQKFWSYFCFVYIIYHITYNFIIDPRLHGITLDMDYLIGFFAFLPTYIAVVLQGFKKYNL